MRDFIGDNIHIDGRMICYRLVTANDYLRAKNEWSEEEVDQFVEKNWEAYTLITQIMALKQSCFLLRRVSHSCQSLSDGLYSLKLRLIRELREEHQIEFDDEFVEQNTGAELDGNWREE